MNLIKDTNSKHISHNITAIATQVIVSGVVLFILYRYLYNRLGVEQIGVWSLVTSIASISRIGDLGLSAGVVKFVAQALGRRDAKRAADVVQTVALTLGVLMAALLIVGYPLFTLALGYFLPTEGISIAMSILPYALISLWLMVMVSVFSGSLDGCLRMDLRSLLTGSSSVVYLGLVMLLTPKYGLKGVVMAQLIQSTSLMMLLWWTLRRQLKNLPLIPWHWRFTVLKEMVGYGVNFQIISILSMLFDPVTKALMSKFGGLEALGYYGMANTFILQGRAVIVEASRVMVPTIASLQEHDLTKATQLFITSYRITFYVSVLFYGLLGISITTISMLWLGQYQAMFIQFSLLLVIGWFVNTLIGPAYFSNLGSGRLRDNVISHAIIGLCSLFVGSALGLMNYGGVGIVIGVITGLIAGSMFLLISHIRRAGLYWATFIIPQNMTKLLIPAIFMTLLANYGRDQHSSFTVVLGIAFLCGVFLLSLGWFNPARMMLKGIVNI